MQTRLLSRLLARVLGSLLLVGLLPLLGAQAPAAAADPSDYLGFSDDGQHFETSWDGQVWDSAVVWVPGDLRRDGLWLRNLGPDPADVLVRVVAGPDDTLAQTRAFSVKVRGRARHRAWSGNLVSRLDETRRTSRTVVLANHLRPGRRFRFRVEGELPFTAGERTRRRFSDLRLEVVLVQDVDRRRPATRPVASAAPLDAAVLPGGLLPALALAGAVVVVHRRGVRRRGGRRG